MTKTIIVHFFRPSGKWYAEETVQWSQHENMMPHANLSLCLREHFRNTPNRLKDMIIVCTDDFDYCPIMGTWNGKEIGGMKQ